MDIVEGAFDVKQIASLSLSVLALAIAQSPAFAQAQAEDLDCVRCVDTVDIAPKAVINGKIGDAAITTGKIKGGAVSTGKLQNQAVTQQKLAPGSVSSGKIQDGAIQIRHLSQVLRDRLFPSDDLTGAMYCMRLIETELFGNGNRSEVIENHATVKLNFTSPTQVSFRILGEAYGQLDLPADTVSNSTDPGETLNGTYTIDTTQLVLTLPYDEGGTEDTVFYISPDHNVVVGGWGDSESGYFSNGLMVGVQGSNCAF